MGRGNVVVDVAMTLYVPDGEYCFGYSEWVGEGKTPIHIPFLILTRILLSSMVNVRSESRFMCLGETFILYILFYLVTRKKKYSRQNLVPIFHWSSYHMVNII